MKTKSCNNPTCIGEKAPLEQRPLLDANQSLSLESIFKLLSNATRLRILHALVINKELCVNDLSELLDMKPQAISNQLQLLAHREVVDSERVGVQIFYRITDPCIIALLDKAWCLAEDTDTRNYKKFKQKSNVS